MLGANHSFISRANAFRFEMDSLPCASVFSVDDLPRIFAHDAFPFAAIFAPRMNPKLFHSLNAALASLALMLTFSGCASKDEIAARRRWETDDERATREVFRSNWILPSVSNEDKDFFYRPFWKRQP